MISLLPDGRWREAFVKLRFLFHSLCLIGAFTLIGPTASAGEREVSFKTADGWTIYATFSTPDQSAEKVPAVILLPSPEHDRAAFGVYRDPGPGRPQYPGIAPVIASRGVATLSLDLRGRGKSTGPKEAHSLSAEGLSQVYLDVRAALAFLDAQPAVDSSRVGIVAAGSSAEAAVRGWGGDRRVRAMVMLSGRLSEVAKRAIAAGPETPLLLLVSSEDKHGFADMADAYFLSQSKESNIEVYDGLGVGTWMLSLFRQKYPNERPLHEAIGEWMATKLLATGQLTEVAFRTEDGWEIHGNLRLPQGAAEKLPAVILLHSGLSDRYAYHELEVALARAGLAVLNLDWRGKGESTNRGKYFELARAERDRGHLDVKAAVSYLASQPRIDANRVGVVGTVLGAKYAMAALAEEPRLRTAVVLTGYIPTAKEKEYLAAQKPPVLYVTSRGHGAVTQALTEIYQLTREKGSELVVYDGGAIGYQLFKLDKDLLPRVVRWMKEKLSQ
jgi:dienelactone hydrolase